MTAWRVFGILGCVALISIGQLLFKYSALRMSPKAGFWELIYSPYLMAAGIIYVGATFLWVLQLRYVPLNRAYPLFALAFVLVPLLSKWVFDERLNIPYMLGSALILMGVSLCTWYY
ncbi:MAG TPA: 4-amino-4-deoxy-L-arabinose-phospho-UDP flippase [Gammaproteobacteria bacterium]|nr:4-amino-4-deoxy-L-arabinose-phospho-UDP flippase [Gammaproteobacteria bacterium]